MTGHDAGLAKVGFRGRSRFVHNLTHTLGGEGGHTTRLPPSPMHTEDENSPADYFPRKISAGDKFPTPAIPKLSRPHNSCPAHTPPYPPFLFFLP